MTNELLKYKGYLGSVEVSLEDKCLHGKLLHVRDVVSYEGDTVEELRCAFQGAVDDYLETCAELKRDPQKPFSGTFNVRVGPDLHREAAIRAEINGVSLNDLVRAALSGHIQHSKAPYSSGLVTVRIHRSEWENRPGAVTRRGSQVKFSSQSLQEDQYIWSTKAILPSSPH